MFYLNRPTFDQHRQKWKELDKENDIHDILQEQGMEEQSSRYIVMYLKDTKLIQKNLTLIFYFYDLKQVANVLVAQSCVVVRQVTIYGEKL